MKQYIRILMGYIFLGFTQIFSQSTEVNGIIVDGETHVHLMGVNIVAGDNGTTSDETGAFSIIVQDGFEISFSYIGYKKISTNPRPSMTIIMEPTVLESDAITVNAMRAIAGVTPVSFSNLTAKEIETRYTVEDIPMILASEPGVWAYSESGNGTGYSYLSIRGFDQSKIGVMIDGVPLNDNESHQVYWVDHGDLLADASDVQIQRGIGNSLYGSSAFGGSINVNTQIASDKREIKVSYGSGEWNTSKTSLRYRSGKDLGEDLSLTIRTSQVESDGYRENHNSKQKGMFFGLEHRGEKFTNKFRAHLGRDSLVAVALVLNRMSQENNLTISQVHDSLPQFTIIKDKIDLNQVNESELMNKAKEVFSNSETNTIDGVKFVWEDRWVHLRKSNTEPIMRIYAEAPSINEAKELLLKIKN